MEVSSCGLATRLISVAGSTQLFVSIYICVCVFIFVLSLYLCNFYICAAIAGAWDACKNEQSDYYCADLLAFVVGSSYDCTCEVETYPKMLNNIFGVLYQTMTAHARWEIIDTQQSKRDIQIR